MELCNFAHPGTFGHECGKPASLVAIKQSKLTEDGIYYARRCPECAKIRGGENAGVIRVEPLDPMHHVNRWNGRYSE